METISKRAWSEVNLAALEHNYREIRSKIPKNCRFLGIVKADAYSHGAVRISQELERLGADYLAVACLDEAIALRNAGIKMPIMILGTTSAEYAQELVKFDITQTVCSLAMAKLLSKELCGKTLKVHYKIDSGMGRLGFPLETAASDITNALKLPGLEAEGIYSHFAVADEFGDEFTAKQFALFLDTVEEIERESGQHFKIKHCANSGAVINYRNTCLDMIRPGLALYGHYPAGEHGELDLKPVLEFKARISAINEHKAGDTISYGRVYTLNKPAKIAVIGVGYADGLQRALSGKMDVLVNGKRARQVGRICMDMCMIDVTDIECSDGDVVTIFGTDKGETVSVDELAELAGTISYELLCALSRRVPRLYIR